MSFDQLAALVASNTQLKEFYEEIREAMDTRFNTSILVTDLDTIDRSGFYHHTSTATGRPIAGFDGRLIHIKKDDNEATQIDILGENNIAFRDKDTVGEGWGEWRFVWSGERASQFLAEDGYQKLPSGLITQWGKASGVHDDVINFPIPFPNAAFSITCTENESDKIIGASNLSSAGFTLALGKLDGTTQDATSSVFYWMATGH